MAGIVLGLGLASNGEVAGVGGAGFSRPMPAYVAGNGAYRICQASGLITTIAIGSASAGHVWACRWSHATKLALITKLRVREQIVTPFTAAQEFGIEVLLTRSYSASHSGGTAATLSGANMRKRETLHGSSQFADMRIAGAAALTNGTHTIDSNLFGNAVGVDLVAAATVPKTLCEFAWGCGPQDYPLALSQNTGIIVRNGPVVMGAGGTARLAVEMEWLEVDAASWPE